MARLVRGLGLAAAISLNVANIIGTGVFLKARVMTCNVGSPGAVLAVWFAAGLLVLAGALTYAELTAMYPRAGGEYVILREAYGRRIGFLYGWSYLAVSRPASLAAQAVSAAIFLNIATGGALEGRIVPAAAGAIALFAAVNCAAVRTTGAVATAVTVVKVALVAGVGAAVFALAPGDWLHFTLDNQGGACAGVAEAARGGAAGFGAAMLGALWGYQGWANLAPLSGETRDPGRTLPRAFALATLLVAALYLFANASYFYALTPTEIAGVSLSSSVATEALARFLGPAAAAWMAMGMMVSSFGALHSGLASSMRVPYAMAADGLYFRGLERLSPRTNVPVRSAVFVAVVSSALALAGNYDKLTDYAVFIWWLFYGLTAGAVLVLRRKQPEAERPYRVWGYPLVPAVFLLATAALLINTLIASPWQSFAGLGFVALGIPFYAYWSRRPRV